MKTLVVVPSLNERENIDWIVDRFQSMADDETHMLLADDDSIDGTWRRYGTLAGSDERLKLLRRTGRFKGRGSATIEAFDWALTNEHGYERIVEMAANRSDDPAHVPLLLERLEDTGADVVVATRSRTPGADATTPRYSRGLARWATGAPISDPDSGFRAWTREAIEKLGIETLKAPGWNFPQVSLARAARLGMKIEEQPVPRADAHGGTDANRGKEPGTLALIAIGVRRLTGAV